MIMDGITLGTGAVVGAQSLVNKDVPPYAIVAGTPARIIRYRFEPALIERLLASQWWELPAERLAQLPMEHPEALLAALADQPPAALAPRQITVQTNPFRISDPEHQR